MPGLEARKEEMPFLDNLTEMRQGGVLIEASEGLDEIIKAVRKTGKKGKLTLTLTVMPADRGRVEVERIAITDSIKVDAPKPDKSTSFFFVNENNQLTKNDERQLNMLEGLKEILEQPKGTPREVK